MARTKIDPAVSRKAYAEATKALKDNHEAEFADLLDAAYDEQGVESPRQRRIRLESEAVLRRSLAAKKRDERKQAKIDEARALLEEAGMSVIPGTGQFDAKSA